MAKKILIIDDDLAVREEDELDTGEPRRFKTAKWPIENFKVDKDTKAGYKALLVTNFWDAAKTLCTDPDIVGVIVDNGFLFGKNTRRVGTPDLPAAVPQTAAVNDSVSTSDQLADHYEDAMHEIEQGPPGAMLLRWMRTGNTGAVAREALQHLAGLDDAVKAWLGDGYDQRMAQLKTMPVVWNSGTVLPFKVETIKAVARNEAIDSNDQKFRPRKLKEGEIAPIYTFEKIDNYTMASKKDWGKEGMIKHMHGMVVAAEKKKAAMPPGADAAENGPAGGIPGSSPGSTIETRGVDKDRFDNSPP